MCIAPVRRIHDSFSTKMSKPCVCCICRASVILTLPPTYSRLASSSHLHCSSCQHVTHGMHHRHLQNPAPTCKQRPNSDTNVEEVQVNLSVDTPRQPPLRPGIGANMLTLTPTNQCCQTLFMAGLPAACTLQALQAQPPLLT